MPTCMNKRPPFLVFNTDDAAGGTGTPPAQEQPKPTIDGESFDFPIGTPLTAMTADQREAYWRHEAKKQQKIAQGYTKLGSIDDVVKKLSDADAAAQAALTDQEKSLNDARATARAEGYAEARDTFARPAVAAILVSQTKRADETPEDAANRVNGVLELIDVQKFVGEDGSLDAAKVETFAQSLGSGAGNGSAKSSSRLADALSSTSQTPLGSGGSVSDYQARVAERLSKK